MTISMAVYYALGPSSLIWVYNFCLQCMFFFHSQDIFLFCSRAYLPFHKMSGSAQSRCFQVLKNNVSISTLNAAVPSIDTRSATGNMLEEPNPHNYSEHSTLWQDTSPRPLSAAKQSFVPWHVEWHNQPLCMVLFMLSGLLLAAGHHFYYLALHGQVAGTMARQQWAHNIGNVFAVLIVTTLHAANGRAYEQFLWLTVRGKGFSLATLDCIFSLTWDLTSFLNMELLSKAPAAGLLAFLY